MPLLTLSELRLTSVAPAVRSAQTTELANSYPDDLQRALALLETTMTSTAEREKAFKQAGLN